MLLIRTHGLQTTAKAIALLATLAICAPASAQPRAEERHPFWQGPPESDPETVFVWQFDEQAGADDAIDSLAMDLLAEDEEGGGLGGVSAVTREIDPAWRGEATMTDVGRFGGGVRLEAEGALDLTDAPMSRFLEPGGAMTLEFWVRPTDATPDETPLIVVDGQTPEILVWRTADGRVHIRFAGQEATHPRRLPDDRWRHMAVVFEQQRETAHVHLTIDGAPLAGDVDLTAERKLRFWLARGLLLGGAGNGAGLVGTIDAVRLRHDRRRFYELEDETQWDPEVERELRAGSPWFMRPLEPILEMTFDQGLDPDTPAGDLVEIKPLPRMFAPGVRGRAIRLNQIGDTGLVISDNRIMPTGEGTIEFWMRPLGWDNDYVGEYRGSDVPRMLLMWYGPTGQPRYRSVRGFHVMQGRAGKDSAQPYVPIHPGGWIHVVHTWGGRDAGTYLNGRPQPLRQVLVGSDAALRKTFAEAVESGRTSGFSLTIAPSDTLLDELRIYDRPMTAHEIRNSHARYFDDAESRLEPVPEIDPQFAYWFYEKRLTLSVACRGVDGQRPVTLRVAVLDAETGEAIAEMDAIELDTHLGGSASLPVELGFGEHPVRIESVTAEGEVVHRLETTYVREKPVWWRNQLGVSDQVPPPWTSIEVNARTLKVWDRRITVGEGGLPDQIHGAAADFFAAPPRIHGEVDGKAVDLKPVAVSIEDASDTEVRWTGVLEDGPIRAKLTGRLEYDGLMEFRVALEPTGDDAIEAAELFVDFALRGETASQLIVNGGARNFRRSYDVRMIPQGDGRVWDSRTSKPTMLKAVAKGHFCPVIWIGGDDRGLCFFGENDRGWTPRDDRASQEIHREGDRVIYRMNVITEPVTIDEPRAFSFVLIPTPTKPLPEDWRSFNRGRPGEPLSQYDVIDVFMGMAMTDPADQPGSGISFELEPHSWQDAAIIRDRLIEKFGPENPVFKYVDASWPSLGPSMDDYRRSLWSGGRMAYPQEVIDYYVWAMNEWLKRDLIEGMYIDDVSMGHTRATYTTAYRLPDGTIQPGFSSMGLREVFKRLWVIFHQQGKRPHIVSHMTWAFDFPALSFNMGALNGEDRVIPPGADPDFIHRWRRDEMRVMGNTAKFGWVGFWIPEIKTDGFGPKALQAWLHRQGRAMHGMIMQYDYWYLFTYPHGRLISDALLNFGIDQPGVEFLPYWELEKGAVEVTGENAQAVVYRRGKTALLMVTNFGEQGRRATITVDPTTLFGSDGRVTFEDVDPALMPPEARTASRAEIREAEKSLLDRPGLEDDDLGLLGEDGSLELDDPDAARKKKYQVETEAHSANVFIRPHDYRLLRVQLRPE